MRRVSSHGAVSTSRSQIQSRSQSSPLRRFVAISSVQINLARMPILPTTVVGSYPQPEWLVDRQMLGSRLPPRTRALEIWRVAPAFLEQAQDDATLAPVAALAPAGIGHQRDRQ